MKRIYPTGKDHPFYGKKHTAESRRKSAENRTYATGKDHHFFGVRRLGKENPAWKRGWYKNIHGYIVTSIDGIERYQHRVVMEKKIGRKLGEKEVVHHINGVRSDNRPDNLELLSSQSEHMGKNVHNGNHK